MTVKEHDAEPSSQPVTMSLEHKEMLMRWLREACRRVKAVIRRKELRIDGLDPEEDEDATQDSQGTPSTQSEAQQDQGNVDFIWLSF
jgi:hypothetical protein